MELNRRHLRLGESKMNEEDLFPNASEEEVKSRKEEIKSRKEEQRKQYLKRLAEFEIGNKVVVKKGVHLNLRLEREGQEGEIVKFEPADPQRIPYPIKVRFHDPHTQRRYTVDWFAPEEVEKVSEGKVNEEDLFPSASKEDLESREVESYSRMDVDDLIDILVDKYKASSSKDSRVIGDLKKYKGISKSEAEEATEQWLGDYYDSDIEESKINETDENYIKDREVKIVAIEKEIEKLKGTNTEDSLRSIRHYQNAIDRAKQQIRNEKNGSRAKFLARRANGEFS